MCGCRRPLTAASRRAGRCGGIESTNNVKAFVELGAKFDAGCITEAPGTPTAADGAQTRGLVCA